MKSKKLRIIGMIILAILAFIFVIKAFYFKKSYSVNNHEFSDKVNYEEIVFKTKEEKPISLKRVSDGYLIISEINIVDSDDDYSSDVRISKYDFNFNKKWNYDYICYKELKKIGVTKKEKFSVFVSNIEEDYDVYHIVLNISNEDGDFNSALLIFDNEGSLYKNKIFEDTSLDTIVDISKEKISLAEVNNYYEYNLNTEKVTIIKPEISNKNEMEIMDKDESLYYAYSYINYYSDEDDNNIVEGDNSFYLLDNKLKIIKKISLDEAIGIKIDDEHNVDYGTIKRMGDKFYLPYNTTLITDESEDPDYYGLLIIDKDLNNTHNIKYDDPEIKDNIESIFDCYVSGNELLYVLSETLDNYIMVEKFDNKYNSVSSDEIKIPEFNKFEDSYSFTDMELINMDDKGFDFYQIFDDDEENINKAKTYLRIYSIKY